jgi:hypothetical protein
MDWYCGLDSSFCGLDFDVVFFPEVGGSTLDSHHGFVVEYGMDRDVELGRFLPRPSFFFFLLVKFFFQLIACTSCVIWLEKTVMISSILKIV